jgi:hypothetical protein
MDLSLSVTKDLVTGYSFITPFADATEDSAGGAAPDADMEGEETVGTQAQAPVG